MLEEYEKRPSDFTRQIIADGTLSDIRNLESKILDVLNVKIDESFYNQANGNLSFYCKGHTKKTREKMSKSRKGKKLSYQRGQRIITEEHAKKLHEGRKNSKNTEEHNEILRQQRLGKVASPETRKKQSLNKLGKKLSDEHKKNIGKSIDYSFMKTEAYKEKVRQAWVIRKSKTIGGITSAGE